MTEKRSTKLPNARSQKRRSKLSEGIVIALIGAVATIIVAFIPFLMKEKPTDASLTETLNVADTPITNVSAEPLSVTKDSLSALPDYIDSFGVKMRLVPAGEFTMGSDSSDLKEQPVHQPYLAAFYIDKYEVTNILYESCVNTGVCNPPHEVSSPTHPSYYGNREFDNYPVIYVDWFQAKNFCEWRGAQLPTEAQWEKAARGMDGRTYPWGEGIGCDRANFSTNCVNDVTEVGRYEIGKSPYGIYDMAGNVWEWVSSLDSSYPYNVGDGRENLASTGPRLIRGGAWDGGDLYAQSSFRFGYDPTIVKYSHGFRCANDANP